MREGAEAEAPCCCRGMTAEGRGILGTIVTLLEFLLLLLALSPFGPGAEVLPSSSRLVPRYEVHIAWDEGSRIPSGTAPAGPSCPLRS